MSNPTMSLAVLQGLPVQPHADAYPIISDEELLELAQDIEENGLAHPIVLWNEHILDGRNRLRALAKTKITQVPVEYFEGTEYEAVCHIVTLNVHRRHMTTGQRAFAALDFLPYEEAEAEKRMLAGVKAEPGAGSGTGSVGKARDLAGERFNVSGQRVQEAKKLALNAEDLAADVRADRISLDKAVKELKSRQDNSPGATAGDKTRPQPEPTYGQVTGADTSWAKEERYSYEEQRANAIGAMMRELVRVSETIARYEVVDGDVVDSPELPANFGVAARRLADLFGDVADLLGA